MKHILNEIKSTKSCSLRTDARSTKVETLACKRTCMLLSQFLVHSIHIAHFSSAYTDITGRINRGIVMESANHYYQYPLYVIPNIEDSEITSDLVSEKANILIPQTMSIEKTESEDVVVTDLLTSSDGAYAKTVVDGKITSYEKESGDTDGPFAFACLAQKNGADAGADESTDAAAGEDSPAEGDSAADESG